MKDAVEILEMVKIACQIVVLFLAIAALVCGERERIRNANDLATLTTLISERNAAPAYTPVNEPTETETESADGTAE